ncbi:hypothetical protein QAD02_014976 [Eretmocerus hayati]|uniref:Uncharacterized protein n=1 Tax=Eretmocerus hayati TaxID=131215 RepID=A0ACC2P9B8_9HYME|nr:hypothetical protein QAD02_014976 [Eretmocerus hayati]
MLTSTWDADLMFSYESSSDAATTVVSDDIWKKFDLDAPLDNYTKRYKNDLIDDGISHASNLPNHITDTTSSSPNSGSSPPSGMMMMMHFDKLNCRASREIRHHDCMWAGLCISKEHNRTHPARRDPQLYQRIPAGHSILISPAQYQHTIGNGSSIPTTYSRGLESDGYSTRSQTPSGSCSDEEETEESEEDEAPVFRHEQINVNEQLNSIVSMPVSEVTGQSIQRRPQPVFDRRKTPAEERVQAQQDVFEDHCYYSPINKKMVDQLGAPTPSDSGESNCISCYYS